MSTLANDAITAGSTTIVSNGDEIEAYGARPAGVEPVGSVVVIHHLPGYDGPTKEIVRRFAAEGFAAACPNLFHREAPGLPPAEASAIVRGMGGVPDPQVVADVLGTIDYLKAQPTSNGRVGVIGYCSGGRHAFLAACELTFDAVVVCYGGYIVTPPAPDNPLKSTTLLDRTATLSCPMLGLFGEQDGNPSPADVAELQAALDEHGKKADLHIAPEAGHAYFAVDRPNYRPAAANDGWAKVLAFFGEQLT